MRVVICEDKPEDRNTLYRFIDSYFTSKNCPIEIATYESGDSFLEDWEVVGGQDTKIAFLDIFMDGTDGMEVARKIRETDDSMVIIFTTTSTVHMLEGYSVYAYQYLLKPIRYPQVAEVLDRCVKQFADSLRHIEVLSERRNIKIFLKDIVYIESFDKTVLIHTRADITKSYIPLSELETQLEGSTFLRANRSYLVNMSYIDDMRMNDFILSDGTAIPISRGGKAKIKQMYMDYLSKLTRGS